MGGVGGTLNTLFSSLCLVVLSKGSVDRSSETTFLVPLIYLSVNLYSSKVSH